MINILRKLRRFVIILPYFTMEESPKEDFDL